MIVSKYVGETEKNLRQLSGPAESDEVLLFFDEADALFGKRTEVRDSHDRYANLGTDHLLQRLEAVGDVWPPVIDVSAYEELVAELLERIPAHTPEWTDHNDSDPGVTILGLVGFLAGSALYWAMVWRLLDRLGLLQRTATVTVEGERWSQVDTLDSAGPDDRVFRLDPETGAVEFGDGVHGKPPAGTVTTRAGYRTGAGAVGVVVAAGAVWAAGTWWLVKRRGLRLRRFPK